MEAIALSVQKFPDKELNHLTLQFKYCNHIPHLFLNSGPDVTDEGSKSLSKLLLGRGDTYEHMELIMTYAEK